LATFTLRHLTARYFRFKFTDPQVRTVNFSNPFGAQSLESLLNIQALVKYQGKDWERLQNWSTRDSVGFCRDRVDERLEELVIIYSYSEWQDRTSAAEPDSDVHLEVSNIGCWRWAGEVTVTAHHADDLDIYDQTETQSSSDVVLERFPTDGSSHWYAPASGTVRWTHNGRLNDCTGEASGTYTLPSTTDVVTTALLIDQSQRHYYGLGIVPTGAIPEMIYDCPSGVTQLAPTLISAWLFIPRYEMLPTNGVAITGTRTEVSGDTTYTWSWRLEAQREP
jgi:hypothetical protein